MNISMIFKLFRNSSKWSTNVPFAQRRVMKQGIVLRSVLVDRIIGLMNTNAVFARRSDMIMRQGIVLVNNLSICLRRWSTNSVLSFHRMKG